jgi:hypothetical protein
MTALFSSVWLVDLLADRPYGLCTSAGKKSPSKNAPVSAFRQKFPNGSLIRDRRTEQCYAIFTSESLTRYPVRYLPPVSSPSEKSCLKDSHEVPPLSWRDILCLTVGRNLGRSGIPSCILHGGPPFKKFEQGPVDRLAAFKRDRDRDEKISGGGPLKFLRGVLLICSHRSNAIVIAMKSFREGSGKKKSGRVC